MFSRTEGDGTYGQNLAASASVTDENSALADAITNLWYNGEVSNFAGLYGEESPSMDNFENWGHFTQLVWLTTTSVGCAVQKCASGTIFDGYESYFTVCNYGDSGEFYPLVILALVFLQGGWCNIKKQRHPFCSYIRE
jgi:hypothetical protein